MELKMAGNGGTMNAAVVVRPSVKAKPAKGGK